MLLFAACDAFVLEEEKESEKGTILLSLDKGSVTRAVDESYRSGVWDEVTVGNTSITLDTNSFILSIYGSDGAKIYSGPYSKKPAEIVVVPGSYDIKLHSIKFDSPWFDSPLFGDEQTVIVESAKNTCVVLACRQLNSGIRLICSSSFLKRFPNNIKFKDDNGTAVYPKMGNSYMFLHPGNIELLYEQNEGADTVLMSRMVQPAQMLTLSLYYSTTGTSGFSGFSIKADTSRVWIKERFNVGLKTPSGVYSIWQAKEMVGQKNIAVFGYILGGDATTTTMKIAPPFDSKTHIMIAPSMSERNRNNIFAIELPSGSVRDNLNLASHPELLGIPVVVTGEIVDSYFGYKGVKGAKSYAFLL